VWKDEHLLSGYGIRHLEARIIRCGRKQAVETWRKLERALLLKFRESYGKIPLANKAGSRMSRKLPFLYNILYFKNKWVMLE